MAALRCARICRWRLVGEIEINFDSLSSYVHIVARMSAHLACRPGFKMGNLILSYVARWAARRQRKWLDQAFSYQLYVEMARNRRYSRSACAGVARKRKRLYEEMAWRGGSERRGGYVGRLSARKWPIMGGASSASASESNGMKALIASRMSSLRSARH